MRSDPIVDEVHAARDEISRENGDDLGAIFRSIRELEKQSSATFVRLDPRPPTPGAPGAPPVDDSTEADAA